mmetsp:Transcript_573/g.866  ORF Transcript_573/g.866 Transcript_573/m.866 type:complete len:99 (-) Transcript_573:75-371(-)
MNRNSEFRENCITKFRYNRNTNFRENTARKIMVVKVTLSTATRTLCKQNSTQTIDGLATRTFCTAWDQGGSNVHAFQESPKLTSQANRKDSSSRRCEG